MIGLTMVQSRSPKTSMTKLCDINVHSSVSSVENCSNIFKIFLVFNELKKTYWKAFKYAFN
jgi:hypothetical protein